MARDVLRDRLGVEVRRVTPPPTPHKQTLVHEVDEVFNEICATAEERSGEAAMTRSRMFNLVQVLDLTRQRQASGLYVECGCYRGASSYVLNRYLQMEDPTFGGEGFHIFDSFEGISELSVEDRPADQAIPWPRHKGLISSPLKVTRRTLSDFPGVTFHPGWIPHSLGEASDGPYRFVHLDLDVHDPTRDCLELFYPRLSPGGAIVCDDYGMWRWPGVATAVDKFSEKHQAPVLRLSSGQAVILARR